MHHPRQFVMGSRSRPTFNSDVAERFRAKDGQTGGIEVWFDTAPSPSA
jgi:hypothetical protein